MNESKVVQKSYERLHAATEKALTKESKQTLFEYIAALREFANVMEEYGKELYED